jgi:O-antigen ligase
VVATGVLLVSMSRAVLLAAAVWPLVALWRLVVTGRMTAAHLALAAATMLALLAAAASGFAQVIWYRFTADTSSYESRNGLLDLALENIRESPVTGGADTGGASAHNLVLDAWQRSGIFAAIAAAVLVLLLLGLVTSLVVRIGEEPDWMLPVAAALALPLVRIFTAGGGLIPPVSWVVLGFVAGAIAFRTATPSVEPPPVGAHQATANDASSSKVATSHG